MKRWQSGMVTMEALALISALCIVGIFVFAHYSRQAAGFDAEAQMMAREIKPKVEAFFQAEPQARLSTEVLKSIGAAPPEPLRQTVTPLRERAEDWQLVLWHPEGRLRYIIAPTGITSDYR